jgi:hypothetical protein
MPSATHHLNLPLLAAGQAQKHITHNEAIAALDALVFLSVASAGANIPPASAAHGERHLVGPAPTGAWEGQAGRIAVQDAGTWDFHAPQAGWLAWRSDTQTLTVFNGTGWHPLASTAPLAMLGVNATADATNRLAVASDAALFTHDGAGHQIKINKAATAQTASLLYQTNWSGRAELGLPGTDGFQIKVSPDGSAWTTALHVAGDGKVGINTTAPTGRLTVSGTDTTGLTPDFLVVRQGYYALAWYETFSSTAGHSPFAIMRRARGTIAAPEAVQQGDQLGGFAFRARNPAGSFSQTALVNAVVGGTPSGTNVPTDMTFNTGTASALERMRINASGDVGIGTNSPTARLHVSGALRIGSFSTAELPAAATIGAGGLAYVSDAAGGATMAFCDGVNWRKIADRSILV